MAFVSKSWLVLSLAVLIVASCMQHTVLGASHSQVPCLFVFGNSLSDSGNNNNLSTRAKANFLPYGIDFPTGPTGRFTNGLNPIDKLAQILGFEHFVPPFANLTGSDILKGVDYASGSAGIRKESGKQLGQNIDIGLQVTRHRLIVSKIVRKLGSLDKAVNYLKKCLYYVNIGTNDYEQNYFLPNIFNTSQIYTPKQYSKVLIHQLNHYLQTLHHFGARKTIMVGMDRLGCIPKARLTNNGSCIEEQNVAAFLFNDQLKALVDRYNHKILRDSKFIFINSTAIIHDKSHGFTITDAACCQLNVTRGVCLPNLTPCQNRSQYKFWDGIHSTEAANIFTAQISYSTSDPNIAHPMNIKKLVSSNTIN